MIDNAESKGGSDRQMLSARLRRNRVPINGSRFWRQVCAIVLTVAAPGVISPVFAGEAWELRRPGVTVIVEGDRALADRTLTRVLLAQYTARLVLGWPKDFQPRPVLAVAITDALTRKIFVRPDISGSTFVSASARSGGVLATPALMVISAPLKAIKGHELDTLQYLYGTSLLLEAPTAQWPECARLGFGMIFASAQYTLRSHLFIDGHMVLAAGEWQDLIRPTSEPLDPARFLADDTGRNDELLRDRRGYSCFLFAQMYATGTAELRSAIAEVYAAVGRGAPLEASIPAGLGGTLPEFAKRFHDFGEYHWNRWHELDIVADFSLPDPLATDATAVEPVRLEAILNQLCVKFESCRSASTHAPP